MKEQENNHFEAWEKALCAIPETDFATPDLNAVRLRRLRQHRGRHLRWVTAAAAGVLVGSMTFTFSGLTDRTIPAKNVPLEPLAVSEMSFAWDRTGDLKSLENAYREIRQNARWEISYEWTDKEMIQ